MSIIQKALSVPLSLATYTIKIGNPRADLVKLQLGYCLQEIDTELQRGLGAGMVW